MTSFALTPETTVHRIPKRASYDRAVVHAILDEALVAHVGIVQDGQPFVLPVAFVRVDDCLYVHGAAASRLMNALAKGTPACVTVTLLDGLVLAKSAFHHSMNYRSVVVLGEARLVTDAEEKARAFDALVERMEAGRSGKARPPTPKELAATKLLAIPMVQVSAKSRAGGPVDDPEDAAWPCWSGHVPLGISAGERVTFGSGR
jgi:uncharacterized protein